MKNKRLQNQLIEEIDAFLTTQKSLMLSTSNEAGLPHASYAPFAIHENELLIFISQLAAHTQHLLMTPKAGVLMIEDESLSQDVFARTRLSYQVKVEAVDREDAFWPQGIALLKDKLGDRIDLLSQLGDFVLFRLSPIEGRFVKGFGRAYEINPGSLADELTHITK
ncbi:MAG: HugZ family protein [Marinomonas sp.]|jgi:putative heme iron utilization protein